MRSETLVSLMKEPEHPSVAFELLSDVYGRAVVEYRKALETLKEFGIPRGELERLIKAGNVACL